MTRFEAGERGTFKRDNRWVAQADLDDEGEKMNNPIGIEVQQLLKPSDVARILNISRSLSYRLLENGDIPVVRINTTLRVKPEDLLEYINKCSGSRPFSPFTD